MELWVKLAAAVSTVLALSLVAERVSPRASGVLAGYPLGTAIALFFIGLENGADFAAESAVHTLGGLSASLVLVLVYYSLSWKDSIGAICVAGFGSVAAFFLTSVVLGMISLGAASGAVLTAVAAAILGWSFRRVENWKLGMRGALSIWHQLARALAAAGILLVVTGTARLSGPGVAGHLAAFPSTLFPLLLIVHGTYGHKPVRTIIKHFPLGMGALLLYTLSVALTYDSLGLASGTLIAFAVATLYLGILAWLPGLRRKGANVSGGTSA